MSESIILSGMEGVLSCLYFQNCGNEKYGDDLDLLISWGLNFKQYWLLSNCDFVLTTKIEQGPQIGHEVDSFKKIGYDNTIISCLNLLFGAAVGKDKINLLFILSYCFFVILILGFWWVSNLIA